MSDPDDLLDQLNVTIDIFEELENQRGLPFHILTEAVQKKPYFSDKLKEAISNVQKFSGEVAQFKADVEEAASSNKSRKEVAKKIAYEEDQAINDLKRAAEAVIEVGRLQDKAFGEREEHSKNGNTFKEIEKADKGLLLEAMLRDLCHYYWDSYAELRTLALKLERETRYDQFKIEINEIKDDSEINRAEGVIREHYDSPSILENDRYAGLEKNASKLRDRLK